MENPTPIRRGIFNQPSENRNQQSSLACSSRKRQQGDVARLLDCRCEPVLVRCAHAGQAARHDLAALRDKLAEHPVVLVVDVFDSLDAELADLLAPEEFASAFAWRSTRTAPTAAKTRTVAARPARSRPFARCRLLWCFRLFCHNSP